ncbi:hypothetical protein [Flavobacterium hankyongi]|uniref:Uncharacterized protein n=1 Tax=Flavobacterium hankyongi TaxID=1176532 RepID=A0ABP8ZVD4_9FLAO
MKSALTLLGILYSSLLISQTQDYKDIYTKIDKELSIGNLNLEKGKIYINKDVNVKNNHRYLFNDATFISNIKHNKQIYYNNNVKYDIFQNILIVNPSNQSKRLFVELSKNEVESFTIENKNFVLIELPNNENWYCEENLISSSFTFYIKYQKKKKEIISDNVIKPFYTEEVSFFLKKQGKISQIDSKKSIVNQFPELKTEINDFYKMNNHLLKDEKIKFMENLIFKIKSLQK